MSEEPRRKSHAVTWTLSVVGVLLMYVLSFGPECALEEHGMITGRRLPEWQTNSYKPIWWISANTPLGKSLNAWKNWWIEVLEKP